MKIPFEQPVQTVGVLQWFFIQVAKFPNKMAVITPDAGITYHALAQQAAALAQNLRRKGVTQEAPIAILLPPGVEHVVCQIGVLMAQGSCVPLDCNMPESWLNDRVCQLQVKWAICASAQRHHNLHTGLLDFQELLSDQQALEDVGDIPAKHRTHILFTSGTTGTPKAVEIEAQGILRLVVSPNYVELASDDRIACIASPVFDASLFEVWGALLNGATMVVIPKKEQLDAEGFQTLLIQQNVTIMFITSALFNLVAATAPMAFRFFRYLLVGGEALNPLMLRRVLEMGPPEHLLNGYGPTECTTFSLTHPIEMEDLQGGSVPIGRPISRTTAFVLDDRLLPVSEGEIGRLYIGGDGVARGYWNRDELNEAKFVSVTLPGYSSPQRLYDTGDLAAQRADGVFMFHGRTDNQVKIRGHRIELEDLQYQILKRAPVKAAVVILVTSEDAAPFLAAFIVPWSSETFETSDLPATLRMHLPEYMIPRLFVVQELPLTPTGKIDRRRLLQQLPVTHASVERPEGFNDAQYALWLIWRKILGYSDISLDDDFFQLGGSSLQAASLIIELRRRFTPHCSVQTLYEAPTLRKLASVVTQEQADDVQVDVAPWLKDAQLPEDIQPLPGPLLEWNTLDEATVLLTGATGFLGAFFLRDLLALALVKNVICLVRASDDASALQRVEANLSQYGLWSQAFSGRITALAGDLSVRELGLSAGLYDQVSRTVDVVFHLGAHVNYIQPYQAHRAGNIDGTLNILRLVTRGKPKPLHYASTIAAFGPVALCNNVSEVDESEDLTRYLEGLKYDSGYSQSQWVVEQLVWEAKRRGIPLAVYRPGFIMGDSLTGVGSSKDFVARLVAGCITLGAYPALPRQRKEFVPVDYVSAALLTIAQRNINLGRAYHLVPLDHAQSIELDEFFELLGEAGYVLQKLPYAQWVARLDADPDLYKNPLMPLLPMLYEKVYKNLTRWEVYENMPIYNARHTQVALAAANSDLKPAPMDKKLLSLYLDYWHKSGFLRASFEE